MANLSKVIYINEEDYSTLINGGTITKGGVTYSHDPTALYVIKNVSAPEYAETAGYATTAGQATKATQDGGGNVISETYEKEQQVIIEFEISGNGIIFTNLEDSEVREICNDSSKTVLLMDVGNPGMDNECAVYYRSVFATDYWIFSSTSTMWGGGNIIVFYWDDNHKIINLRSSSDLFPTENVDFGQAYGISSNNANLAARTSSISEFELKKGGIVAIKFTTDIDITNPSLNINSTGPKPIYYRGSALSGGTVNAGDTVTFIYDGTYYHIISIDKDIPAPATTAPIMDGTATIGTSDKYAKEDHVHPSDTSRVPTSRKINNKALSTDITLTASDVGADVFVVNIEDDGNGGYTCDKTNAEIYAAWEAGRCILCTYDGYHLLLNEISQTDFSATGLSDEACRYYFHVTTRSGVQSVSGGGNYLQSALVSGTNIKTINNQSLLGSGNLTASDVGAEDRQKVVVKITNISVNNVPTFVDANNNALTHAQVKDLLDNLLKDVIIYWTSNNLFYSLYYAESGDDEYYFSALSADDSYVYWINLTWDSSNNTFDFDNGNYTMQQLLVSGTNIKTINNQSLLGSGNISIANGNDGVGIASVVQTTTSTESGGNNVITVTKTDNSTSTFVVKNGVNGTNGVSLGDVALTQTTGSDTSAVMSQAAVTESLEEYSQKTNFRQVIDPSQAIYTKSPTESIKACTSLETYPFDEILKVDVVFRLTSGGFPNYYSLGNMCSIYLDSNNYIQWRIDGYNCYAEIKTDGTFQLQYTSKIDSGTPRLNSTTRFAFAAVIDLLQKKMSVYGVDSGSMVTIYSVDISSYDLSAFVGQQVKLRTTLYSYNKEYYNIYIRINKMLDLESDLTRTILASGYNAFPSYAKASNFSYGSYINGLTLGGTVTQTITSTHKKVSATNVSNKYFAIAPKTSKNFASSNLYWSVNIKLLSGSISIAKSAANAVNAVYIYDSSGSRVTTIEQDETYLLLVGALVDNTNYSFSYGLYVTGTFELEVWNPNLFNAQTQNLCSETWDGNCFTGIIPFSGNPMFSTATAVGSIKVVNGNLQMWNGAVWKQINNS